MTNIFGNAIEGIKKGVEGGVNWIKDNKENVIKGGIIIAGSIASVILAGKLLDRSSDDYYELEESEFEVYDAGNEPEEIEAVEEEETEEN